MRYFFIIFFILYSLQSFAEVGCISDLEEIFVGDPRKPINANYMQYNPAVMNGFRSTGSFTWGDFITRIKKNGAEGEKYPRYEGRYQGLGLASNELADEGTDLANAFNINSENVVASIWHEKLEHSLIDNESVTIGAKNGSLYFDSVGTGFTFSFMEKMFNVGYADIKEHEYNNSNKITRKYISRGWQVELPLRFSYGRFSQNEKYTTDNASLSRENSGTGLCLLLIDYENKNSGLTVQLMLERFFYDRPNFMTSNTKFGEERIEGYNALLHMDYIAVTYQTRKINKLNSVSTFNMHGASVTLLGLLTIKTMTENGSNPSLSEEIKTSSIHYTINLTHKFK